MTRRIAITITAVLIIGIMAQPVLARGWGQGQGPAQVYNNLTPEKQQVVDQLTEDFQKKSFALKQQLWAKNVQLRALVNSGKADEAAIARYTDEIVKLRTQMFNDRNAFCDKLEQETGIRAPRGMMGGQQGHHRGGHGNRRGGGQRGGQGMMGQGGYGPQMGFAPTQGTPM